MDKLKHVVGSLVNHGSNADDPSADVEHGAGKAERHGEHAAEDFERDMGGTVMDKRVDTAKPSPASAAPGGSRTGQSLPRGYLCGFAGEMKLIRVVGVES